MTPEEMTMYCFDFENRYQMNKLGIFLLDKEELEHINMLETQKSMYFGMIGGNICLSRGKRYYCDKLSMNDLKDLRNMLEQAVALDYRTIVYAVNELLLNKVTTIWYNFQYNKKLLDSDRISQLYRLMTNMATALICVLTNSTRYMELDWELLACVIDNLGGQELDFRVPECDNKTVIIKELCWLLHSNVINEVDTIVFPMFGSIHLMLFCEVILQMYGYPHKCYPINISFHDRIEDNTPNMRDLDFKGQGILVLDDNIGTGNTIKWCKKRITEKEKKCITRVCEIPWDVFERMQRYEVLSENLDIPTIKSNFRILSKNIFIQRMIAGDYDKIVNAKQLYCQEEDELCKMGDRIINLRKTRRFSGKQVEAMFDEYDFYEKILRGRK